MKKPYIFKRSEAVLKSDPVACFHAKEDDKFWETLEKCEVEVKKWPAWKRNIKLLGR